MRYELKSVFLCPKRQNHTSVQYALFLFHDAIKAYVSDKFGELHLQLNQTLAHIPNVCNKSCSKNKEQHWCYTCDSWRTAILGFRFHKQRRFTSIFWKQLDSSLWKTSSAEVMKCFYPDWYFGQGVDGNDDVAVLLHCISACTIFNKDVNNVQKIRNEIAHHTKITNEDKTDKCDTLLKFLQDKDISTYKEAQTAIDCITILKDNTLKDIYVKHLLDEQDLLSLERRLYEKKSCTFDCRFIAYILIAFLFGVLAACMFYYTYQPTTEKSVTYDIHGGFRLDFETFINENASFVGRKWLFEDINKYLTNDKEKGVLIIADPGYGKTAAVEQLIIGKQKIGNSELIYHLCRDDSLRLKDPAFFILNIVYQIYSKIPQYQEIMKSRNYDLSAKNANNITAMCTYDALYCSRVLLILPLKKIKPLKKNILIAVDALNKCLPIVTILSDLCEHTPRWIQFFLTTRNDTKITLRHQSLHVIHLKISNGKHISDFHEFIRHKFPHLTQTDVIDLSQQMKYDFFLFDMVARFDKMKDKNGNFDVNKIPSDVYIRFEREMSFLFDKCSASTFKEARWILEIIAASVDPISVDQLIELHDKTTHFYIDRYAIGEFLQKTRPHIIHVSMTELVTFNNFVFKEWLTSIARKGLPCFIDIQEGRRRLVNNVIYSSSFPTFERENPVRIQLVHAISRDIVSTNIEL